MAFKNYRQFLAKATNCFAIIRPLKRPAMKLTGELSNLLPLASANG
jgi:hypothetical protein